MLFYVLQEIKRNLYKGRCSLGGGERVVFVEALAKIRNSNRTKVLRKGVGDLKYNSVSEVTVCHVFGTFCENIH